MCEEARLASGPPAVRPSCRSCASSPGAPGPHLLVRMARTAFERETAQELPEEEPALIFLGPTMRQGHCIRVMVEDKEVKCLVRYPRGTWDSPATGTGPRCAKPRKAHPSRGPGSAQEPESVANSAEAKRSTSRTGPSTSSSSVWGAMAHEAPCGRSQSSGPIPQGVGGASTSAPQSSTPEEAPQESLAGWDYEWIPQNRVLRYSRNQLKQDRNKAIRLSAARKEQKQAALRGRRSRTWRGRAHHDPGEGSTSGMMPPPPPKQSRPESVRQESRSQGASCRGDAGDPQQDATPGRHEVQVDPPMSLRPLLVLDWDMVTLRKMLCNLPAKVSADAILFEYATFPRNYHTKYQSCAVWGLVAVLREYFNVLLSTQLLYDFERPHDELVVSYPSSQMCELYGGIHLLHLFEHLGPMLTCTALDDSSMNVLLSHVQDFLDYLADNPSLLFFDASDYEPASEEHPKLVA